MERLTHLLNAEAWLRYLRTRHKIHQTRISSDDRALMGRHPSVDES